MENMLSGKIALVTGGSRGIGKAIAEALAAAGADIAVNYASRENLAKETCMKITSLGRRCVQIKADVSVPAQASELVKQVEKDLGPVSILVNNAGIATVRAIEKTSEEDWDETINVDLKSAFLLIQAVLPGMRSKLWGRIINISSSAVYTGGVVGVHYTAAKAGLLGLTRAYAVRLAKEGITVNAIAPGFIKTDMSAALPGQPQNQVPVGRVGTPEEVAQVAVLLAGNGYITGQTININGGMYLG